EPDPPLTRFQVAAGDVGVAVAVEVADLHVHPGQHAGLVRRPGGPQAGGEGQVGLGQPRPPLTVLLDAPGDVRPAVAVEVADLHVHPAQHRRLIGGPGRPQGRGESVRARGQPGPPLAVFLDAPDDVRPAVVIEVADPHVYPGDGGR